MDRQPPLWTSDDSRETHYPRDLAEPASGASRAPVSGERRLLIALLEDALNHVLRPGDGGRGPEARRRERLREEALAWVFSDDPTAFGFLGLCDVLGIDPDYVRGRVRYVIRSRGGTVPSAAPVHRDGKLRT